MKLNVQLLYNVAIALLGIDPSEMKTQVHTRTCTEMFIEALLIIAKNWKQSRCLSTAEWLCKWNATEYYLVRKRNRLMI